MFGIFDKIEEFFKDLLLGGIQANLESMFLDINDKVGAIATDVGKTPMGWNGQVFSFIKSINDSVIIPIAGLIITAVLCIELINDDTIEQIAIFVRRDPGINNEKVTTHIVDFDQSDKWRLSVQGDVVFSCMGTTRKAGVYSESASSTCQLRSF